MFLAFLLWLIVVNYEDPQTAHTFMDVPVNKLNVDVITAEKKAIEYLEGETVTVRVQGKRSIVDRMTTKDIVATADLEKKSITGAVEITVDVPDSVTVISKEPGMMMVDLEDIITVQKEVQPYMLGEPSEGFIYFDPVVTPNNIEIEGPESKIAMIKSVLVSVNVEGVTRDVTLYGSPQVLDDSNEEIKDLIKSAGQVQIQVPIEKVRVINIREENDRTVADGYELIGLGLSQNTLQIRGKEAEVDLVGALTIKDLDFSEMTEDVIVEVNVAELLPDGINIYEDESTVQLYLDIEPVEEKTVEITHGDINVRYLDDTLKFSFIDDEIYTMIYRGVKAELEPLELDMISPSISLRDLGEGIHYVDLNIYTPPNVKLLTEIPSVAIELTKIEEPEEGADDGADGSQVIDTDNQGTNEGAGGENSGGI